MEADRCSELLDSIVEVERAIAAGQVRRAELMAQFVAVRRTETVSEVASAKAGMLAGQFATDEIAAAVCWSRSRVAAEIAQLRLLQTRLPRVLARWRAGEVDGYRVSKVTDAAARLIGVESLEKLDVQAARVAPERTATQLGGWAAG